MKPARIPGFIGEQQRGNFIHIQCTCFLLIVFLIQGVHTFAQKPTIEREQGAIKVVKLAEGLDHPWALAFLPDNRVMVTERSGALKIIDTMNKISKPLEGSPEVFAKGQGGLMDIALDPDFSNNHYIYLSYAEAGQDSTSTTALGRGTFRNDRLNNFEVIFRMEPGIKEDKHFGNRIIFTPEGQILFTLADRFKFDPAQDNSNHMGTIVRINKDGSVPTDNPFVGDPNALDEIWSYGHRNIESAAIDPKTGKLWVAEMGPMGGDELNQPQVGKNYGWPLVSWGRNYDGSNIPNPDTRPDLEDAVIVWTPTISPSGMIFYDGNMFPEWKDHAIIGGLTSSGIVIVSIQDDKATETERVPLAARIRDIAQGPDGAVYVITDAKNGMLLKLQKME
ncbi:PQQ-dependent sugar dehydrogenase [Antarcticibacterium arcticum]|uniref:PQQ-dependent sugar dehydrogenase n=1 Tax=Antarcticibacterium arcticum TaxID=2585771 RepID=A0A5B8YM30_9FLAO|nr:PQQ-dependent sugar dehydrogenase [Antarcticibacterium arcticum]QED37336.1 PQQ-dependent sugar dehydrogenase [Antarcticibacterium arcticum]